jgi:hypothetical protein
MGRHHPVRHIKELERLLRPYNLTIRRGRGHPQIIDATGRRLTPVSSSPSDDHAAIEETLKRLVRLGAMPAETLRRR